MIQTIKISKSYPVNQSMWDSLAEMNSNFFQSTLYDEIQSIYNQIPIYFELWENEKLISGVKIYYWESNKIGKFTAIFSKFISQYGEILYDSEHLENNLIQESKLKIQHAVLDYVKKNKIVSVQITGVYGKPELLLSFNSKKVESFNFNSAYVNLCEGQGEEYYEKFNRNTKRNLKKAVENQLVFSELNNPEIFHQILKKIFSQQIPIKHPPHKKLTDQFYNTLRGKFQFATHQVKKGEEILAVSLFVKCGSNAYSLFGGSIKNELGAGHLLYFELMKKFKNEGICRFYFGQVSQSKSETDKKFSFGISGFKRGFGLTELPSYKKTYTFRPIKKAIWEIMKWMGGLTANK